MTTIAELRTPHAPTWCPGCDDFLLLAGLQQALAASAIPTEKTVIVYDIGCAGNMADFVHTYAVHSLHGRSIAVAMGIKLFRPDLTVIVIGGDGGIYGEGLNHLVAAARANSDIKVFVSNNYLYSLTTGQTSPTTPKGAKTKSTPLGVTNEPLVASRFIPAINDQVWVQKVSAKNIAELNGEIKEALNHQGFALLDVDENCVSFGKQLR
ncbi:thiamine pyrophosphate-dependent enzyme [Patescibacteria group bacterium]|nr:thiamine pyrophosphate-dependent enzyme [Patescibacteria group bacterium]